MSQYRPNDLRFHIFLYIYGQNTVIQIKNTAGASRFIEEGVAGLCGPDPDLRAAAAVYC